MVKPARLPNGSVPGRRLGDRYTRFVTHQVLDVAHHALVELLTPYDRDVLRKIERLPRIAIGIDADRIQRDAVPGRDARRRFIVRGGLRMRQRH